MTSLLTRDRAAAWSKNVSEEIRRRVNLVARLDTSERARSIARKAIADPVDGLEIFVRDFVWTYDPRNRGASPKDLPLAPWPKQVEFLRWLQAVEESGDNGVCDKSRDVGVTWLVDAYMVWRWLTVPGWAGSIGSRKADLMDRLGDPKSVFWKLEYIIRMLPGWLRPPGFDMRKHRSYGRLINPSNGATITGEAGPQMGTGGRSSLYFLDEFGKVAQAASVNASVSGNAATVIYVSTATGPETEFYRLVHEGMIPHFRLSWQHDPRKGPDWRDDYVRRYGPAIAAREVDISYSGIGSDMLIPHDWVLAAVELDLGAATPGSSVSAGFDVADEGNAESVYIQRAGPTVTSVEAWHGVDPVASSGMVTDFCNRGNVQILRYDSIGVGAGVSGALNARRAELRFRFLGVNVGLPATSITYMDAPEMPASERFANLKAELWWSLRLRFWQSWRLVNGESVDPKTCISIPDDHRLILQLTQPKIATSARGLILVESKDSLKRRGVASPDRAEALVLAFADAAGGIISVAGSSRTNAPNKRRSVA